MEGIYVESDLDNINSGNDWQRMSFYKQHFNERRNIIPSKERLQNGNLLNDNGARYFTLLVTITILDCGAQYDKGTKLIRTGSGF